MNNHGYEVDVNYYEKKTDYKYKTKKGFIKAIRRITPDYCRYIRQANGKIDIFYLNNHFASNLLSINHCLKQRYLSVWKEEQL